MSPDVATVKSWVGDLSEQESAVGGWELPSGCVAACLNMDMVGRLDDKLTLFGVGSSSIWPGEFERRNALSAQIFAAWVCQTIKVN